jgi:hypothetical protein
LRFAKVSYFHHPPPVKRGQFTMDFGDGRVLRFISALHLVARTGLVISSII